MKKEHWLFPEEYRKNKKLKEKEIYFLRHFYL